MQRQIQPRHQQQPNNNQIEPFERNIANLMENQLKMFDNLTKNFFGGRGGGMGSIFDDFENDNFGRFGSIFDGIEKDFNNMMISAEDPNQENRVQRAAGVNGGGHFVSQTYAFSSAMGKDGKPVTKKYFSNKVNAVDKNGRRLGEMQEMYHDTGKGKKVIAQERTLDRNGRRVVKRKLGNGKENKKIYFFLEIFLKKNNLKITREKN